MDLTFKSVARVSYSILKGKIRSLCSLLTTANAVLLREELLEGPKRGRVGGGVVMGKGTKQELKQSEGANVSAFSFPQVGVYQQGHTEL